jgi:hypothetical protein
VNALLSACAAYAGGEPSEALRQLTREFIGRARGDDAVLERAAEALKTLPPWGAAWLAVAMGAVVERRGADAPVSARPVVDLLLSWLPQLPNAEAGEDSPTPAQRELLEALQLLGQSVVAHLARAPDLKAELSQNLPLLDRLAMLEPYTAAAAWIRETLLRSSGSLILLHAQSGRGFRLHYRNVATCFHLFSLIQVAIGEQLPGGRKPDARIAEAARGRSHETVQDEAWWHYGDPRSKVADLRFSIWGEALVREIPLIDGERVMLLWPQLLASRTWDSAFFGPQLEALPPDVVVEAELSTADAAAWFEKPGIRRGRRKWWPW